MAEYFWEREPDVVWPPERELTPGREWTIPGVVEDTSPSGDQLEADFDDFTQERNRLVSRVGNNQPPRGPGGTGIAGLPEETPPTDACAYYLSFRFGNQWGIYIGRECWLQIATYLHANGIPAPEAVDEAFLMLYRHEYFHFEVDKAVVILERAVGKSTGKFEDHWITYHRANNPSLLEEALANAHALKHAGKVNPDYTRQTEQLVEAWMRRQPPGYRDFAQVSQYGQTGPARSQLLSEIMGVHRGSTTFVPGFDALIGPKSFAGAPSRALFTVKHESKLLRIRLF